MTVDGWRLQHRSQQYHLKRPTPAEKHAGKHERQNIQVVQYIVQDDGVRCASQLKTASAITRNTISAAFARAERRLEGPTPCHHFPMRAGADG